MDDREPGAILEIELSDGSYAYARALRSPYVAFYDANPRQKLRNMEEITDKRVLFKLPVGHHRPWKRVGSCPLDEELRKPVYMFWQKINDPGDIRVVDESGFRVPATREEVENLERYSVWSASHVERRLLDTFAGRPNETHEFMKIDRQRPRPQ